MAPGSVVAFDYFADRMVTPRRFGWRVVQKATQMAGDRWRFGLSTSPPSRARAAAFLQSCGLRLEQHEPYGKGSARFEPFGGLVVTVVTNAESPMKG